MNDHAAHAGIDDLVDTPTMIRIGAPEHLATSYVTFERYPLAMVNPDGKPVHATRDLLNIGRVVAVLPYDPATDEIVLMRQFRTGAHLVTGKGEMIEIVAGLVDDGEDIATTAGRECVEEIGVAPRQMIELFSFLPAPGFTTEYATLFLGIVDASQVPARAGLEEEAEDIRPMRATVDVALAGLAKGGMLNGYTVHALHWLALNRARLPAILNAGSVRNV